MVLALAGAVSIAAAVAARPSPTPAAEPVSISIHASPVDAVRVALASAPVVVVGFGEMHQTHATAGIPSALRRFTDDIFPAVAEQFSHLVVETWVATGRCGETERAVTADVERATARPASTETEIGALIRQGAAAGVVPRILSISCADYAVMRPPGGAVDYDKTLRITASALQAAVLRSLALRSNGQPRPLLAVYGGALHNDVRPQAGVAPYSFVPGIMAATLGRYLEIDLVVPEYAAGSAFARVQNWWKPYLEARGRASATIMVRRGPRSFVIVFPAQRKAKAR